MYKSDCRERNEKKMLFQDLSSICSPLYWYIKYKYDDKCAEVNRSEEMIQ